MRFFQHLLSLPPCLLLLISTAPCETSGEQQPEERRQLEDEHLIKRGLAAMEKLQSQPPTRVRKMSGDPEEMFFLDYWGWDDDYFDPVEGEHLRARALSPDYSNDTIDFLLPALRPNTIPQESLFNDVYRFFQRSHIAARDFSCPNNSTPCASLNRTDICCGSGETCYIGDDQGCGTVGCCPAGQTCSGPVQCCNTAAGFSNCSDTAGSNGGCCIPNYTCYSTGCISTTTSTTVTTAPTVTVTTGSSPTSSSASQTPPSSSTTTGGAGLLQTGSPSQTTTTSTSSAATTTTVAAIVGTAITSLNSYCPSDYYFCSAEGRPGCCIVGMDCILTSCLSATSTSTLITNGLTIVIPIGGSTGGSGVVVTIVGSTSTKATQTSFPANGVCIGGFQSCSQSLGGGCCPGNFACESGPSCTAISGAGATGEVAKFQPSGASGPEVELLGWFSIGVGLLMGIGMVFL